MHNFLKDQQTMKNIKLALYWILFGTLFFCLERIFIRQQYFSMHCFLDDIIPFCELFVIPYIFWFVFLLGMHLYTFFFEPKSFEKLMQFVIVTYSIALIVYIIYPNKQMLRPINIERDNVLIQFMQSFWQFDTNTNVCPSLHVVGSIAVMLCALNSERFSSTRWKIAFIITAVLISISTVFLKQHSVIDVIIATIVCFIANEIVYKIGVNNILNRTQEKLFQAHHS